jgi:hypothetical protein
LWQASDMHWTSKGKPTQDPSGPDLLSSTSTLVPKAESSEIEGTPNPMALSIPDKLAEAWDTVKVGENVSKPSPSRMIAAVGQLGQSFSHLFLS